MSIQQAERTTNIKEIQNNAELHKRFLTFVDKFNAVGSNLARLNKVQRSSGISTEQADSSGQFSELAGQGGSKAE